MKGISICGNIVVDYVKIVDSYPEKNMLSNISKVETGVGGCLPNTAIALKKIDSGFDVSVFGKVGKDDGGDFIIDTLKAHGIDTDGVLRSDTKTAFSDVITESGSGARTFFHYRGANSGLGIGDIPVDKLQSKIFHLGYLLLLDSLDTADEKYGTKAARLLSSLQNRGIKTSIDVVSESGDRFKSVIIPALKYCDYLVINETEAGKVADISSTVNGKLNIENIKKIMQRLKNFGVREKVIIHCPEYGFSLSDDEFTTVSSLKLPSGYIKGTVGAGDAFCAGALYSIYNGESDESMLKFASLAAASCLSASDSVSGILPKKQLLDLENKFKRT